MTIVNEKRRNDYIGTDALDTYDYEFITFNIADFHIIETVIATGVETEFDSSGDLDGTVGIVGSGSDYEITGLKDEDGGTVKRTDSVLPSTLTLAIKLRPFIIQDTPIRSLGDGHRARLEDEFNRSRQIDLFQQDAIDSCFKLPQNIDPSTITLTVKPDALKFLQWDVTGKILQNAELGALGAITLPGANGLAVFVGSETFINRTLSKTGNIVITNGDGVAGNPTVELVF